MRRRNLSECFGAGTFVSGWFLQRANTEGHQGQRFKTEEKLRTCRCFTPDPTGDGVCGNRAERCSVRSVSRVWQLRAAGWVSRGSPRAEPLLRAPPDHVIKLSIFHWRDSGHSHPIPAWRSSPHVTEPRVIAGLRLIRARPFPSEATLDFSAPPRVDSSAERRAAPRRGFTSVLRGGEAGRRWVLLTHRRGSSGGASAAAAGANSVSFLASPAPGAREKTSLVLPPAFRLVFLHGEGGGGGEVWWWGVGVPWALWSGGDHMGRIEGETSRERPPDRETEINYLHTHVRAHAHQSRMEATEIWVGGCSSSSAAIRAKSHHVPVMSGDSSAARGAHALWEGHRRQRSLLLLQNFTRRGREKCALKSPENVVFRKMMIFNGRILFFRALKVVSAQI